MMKKKEIKKPSAKEETQVDNNNKIFDANGKLILKDENKTEEVKIPETKKKPTKVKIISEEEAQKIKRAYWKEYYHRPGNKEKYAEWNRKWREKQKQKKKKSE